MALYRDRTFSNFDAAMPLVAARSMTLMGDDLNPGDDIDVSKVDEETRRRLWMSHYLTYAEDFRPTPEQEAREPELAWMDEAEGVRVEAGDNGWYTVHAAWLGEEGEKVHGAEAAEARAAEIREAGDTKGVTYAHTGGGWYAVSAPWLDDPVKVQGEEAAKAKAQELRDAHDPEAEAGKDEDTTDYAALVTLTEEDEEYVVSAPWLEEPERFASTEAAEARQQALRDAGPPEGWTPEAADDAETNPGE